MIELKVYRYCLPLDPPLALRNRSLHEREGVLISPFDQPNCWAEAAPLPGYSRETIDDVIRAVSMDVRFQPPSLQFALESLSRKPTTGRVPVSALLHGDPAEILKRAEQLRDLPFPAVKLKIGWQRSLDEEIELVTHVREKLRDDQRLRLDANRRWPLEQAVQFGRRIAPLGIEYIEEPIQRGRECEKFFERTKVPYALDETLIGSPSLERFPHAAALVIKPTLLGSRRTIDRLRATQIPLVFSSCFETSIGLWNIAQLAAHYSPSVPAGIDSARWLKRDPLIPPLNTEQGYVDLDVPTQVDYSLLEEVF